MAKTKNCKIEIPVFSEGHPVKLEVDDETASFIGSYHNAIGRLLRTNKPEAIEEFVGQYVTDINGDRYLLETRPNYLFGLTNAEPDIMDQVYRIIR